MCEVKKRNAGLPIRHYVFGLLRKCRGEATKLPSSYELAKMFGVTRRVARYELEQLQKEGVLFSKPPVGTFINPRMNLLSATPMQRKMPLVGVIDGDGNRFCFGRAENRQMSYISLALADRGCYMHTIVFATTSEETRIQELRNLNLDGIIWRVFNTQKPSPEFLKKVRDTGIPLVIVTDRNYPGQNQIRFITNEAEEKIRKILDPSDGKDMLLLSLDAEKPLGERLAKRLGIPEKNVKRCCFLEYGEALEQFRAAWNAENRPSIVVTDTILAEALPPPEEAVFITDNEMNFPKDFSGFSFDPCPEEAARRAVELLFSASSRAQSIEIECRLTKQGEIV